MQKLIVRSTVGLVCFEVGLAIAYLVSILKLSSASPLIDFNGLRSLPSLLQAAHLLAIGGLSLLLLIRRDRLPHPLSWGLPLGMALLCFYGAADELTKLHLHLAQFNWKLIYLGLLAAIPVLGRRDLRRLWRHYPTLVLWVLAGLGVFLLGGFGAEMVKGAIAAKLANGSTRALFLAEHFRIMVEEFAELLGETLILYAFAQFAFVRCGLQASPKIKELSAPN